MENQESYEKLVTAIYEQAADDYKKSLKIIDTLEKRRERNGVLTKKDDRKLSNAVGVRDECEHFFDKDPYGMLTGTKPGEVCAKLRQIAKEEA